MDEQTLGLMSELIPSRSSSACRGPALVCFGNDPRFAWLGGFSPGIGNGGLGRFECIETFRQGLLSVLTSLLLTDVLGVGFSHLLLFIDGAPEEEIDHNIPFLTARDLASKTKDFASKKPVQKTDGLSGAVVAGNDDIDVTTAVVRRAEGDDRDIDVSRFSDGLSIITRVSGNDQAGLGISFLDLIGKSSGSESSRESGSASEFSEFESSSLTDLRNRQNCDIGGIFDGDNDSRGKKPIFPKF